MLVVIGIIGILMSLLAPALSKAKAKANQIKCLNHMRQVALSAGMYASDYNNEFPPRRPPANAWPQKLQPYFREWKVLVCPGDRFGIAGLLANAGDLKRSYLINGFNDYFFRTLSDREYRVYKRWNWPHGMREDAITNPSETILFGEKRTGSMHVHMDIDQGDLERGEMGNDIEEIDHARHGRGSNFVFVDASVRLLEKKKELFPDNLWCVMDEFRHRVAPPK
jgi:prepilin-type processing-associated H-X9-DG protein